MDVKNVASLCFFMEVALALEGLKHEWVKALAKYEQINFEYWLHIIYHT